MSTLDVIQTDADADCGDILACAPAEVGLADQRDAHECTVDGPAGVEQSRSRISASESDRAFRMFQFSPDVDVWDAGDWVVPVNVTEGSGDDFQWDRTIICRLDTGCGVIETVVDVEHADRNLGSVGVESVTLSAPESTGAETDDAYIVLVADSDDPHGNTDTWITPDQTIETPIQVDVAVIEGSAQASDVDVAVADGEVVLEPIQGSAVAVDVDAGVTTSSRERVGEGVSADVDAAASLSTRERDADAVALDIDAAIADGAVGVPAVMGSANAADVDASIGTSSRKRAGVAASVDLDAGNATSERARISNAFASDLDVAIAAGEIPGIVTGSAIAVDVDAGVTSSHRKRDGVAISADIDAAFVDAVRNRFGAAEASDLDAGIAVSELVGVIVGSAVASDSDAAVASGTVIEHVFGSATATDVDAAVASHVEPVKWLLRRHETTGTFDPGQGVSSVFGPDHQTGGEFDPEKDT